MSMVHPPQNPVVSLSIPRGVPRTHSYPALHIVYYVTSSGTAKSHAITVHLAMRFEAEPIIAG